MDTNNKLPWNKNEVGGTVDKAIGTVKEKIGRVAGDADLEAEGMGQRAGGEIEQGVGKARRKVGEVVKDIGDKLGS